MSYANGTQFYNLPQTVGTDKRDWFDTNAAFAAVDAALHAAATGQAADAEAISTINSKLAADEADIAALQTASSTQAASISTLQTTVNGQAIQIADVRQDAEDMITANNEGAAATSTRAYAIGDYFIYNDVLYKATAAIAIGDTIVPNTNCEATNVDTEITEVKSALTEVRTGVFTPVEGVSSANVSVKQYGKIVEVRGYATKDTISYSDGATANSLGAISGVDMPSVNTLNDLCAVSDHSYDAQEVNYIQLTSSDGAIKFKTTSTGSKVITFNFTYIVD